MTMSIHPLTQIEKSAADLAIIVRDGALTHEKAVEMLKKIATEIIPHHADRADNLWKHGLYLYNIFLTMPPQKSAKGKS
jgi:hypothetical protein